MPVTNAVVNPVTQGHGERMLELVGSARHDLCLVSPFLGREPLELVARTIAQRPPAARPAVHLITNLGERSLLNAVLDVAALARFADSVAHSEIVHLPALHANVYIADRHSALVTSANLTHDGLWRNRECGVMLRDADLVRALRRDMEEYAALGNVIERTMLRELARETARLRAAQVEAEYSAKQEARARLERLLADTRTRLLQARARGKTTNSILADTILYLLRRQGPSTTRELYPLVQELHPDLCDDGVDRVIDGVHFGKKWQHHVRSAQQHLRRRGHIERLADGRWALTGADARD